MNTCGMLQQKACTVVPGIHAYMHACTHTSCPVASVTRHDASHGQPQQFISFQQRKPTLLKGTPRTVPSQPCTASYCNVQCTSCAFAKQLLPSINTCNTPSLCNIHSTYPPPATTYICTSPPLRRCCDQLLQPLQHHHLQRCIRPSPPYTAAQMHNHLRWAAVATLGSRNLDTP